MLDKDDIEIMNIHENCMQILRENKNINDSYEKIKKITINNDKIGDKTAKKISEIFNDYCSNIKKNEK